MAVQGRYSLSYTGVNATNPPNFYLMDRAPTPFDNQNFMIGDLWQWQINTGTVTHPNYTTSKIYHLVAQAVGLATWVTLSSSGGSGINNIKTTYITTTGAGTYTPSPTLVQVMVECVGGGCGSPLRSTQLSGGPSGGYCKRLFDSSQIGSSQSYSVGIGGAASNMSGSIPAGNGGNTTFGSFMTAGGATSGDNSGGLLVSGIGGIASGGDLNINGQVGASSIPAFPSGTIAIITAGTMYGLGGSPTTSNGAGGLGTGYGSGSVGTTTTSSGIGLPGQPGIIIITEYLS